MFDLCVVQHITAEGTYTVRTLPVILANMAEEEAPQLGTQVDQNAVKRCPSDSSCASRMRPAASNTPREARVVD